MKKCLAIFISTVAIVLCFAGNVMAKNWKSCEPVYGSWRILGSESIYIFAKDDKFSWFNPTSNPNGPIAWECHPDGVFALYWRGNTMCWVSVDCFAGRRMFTNFVGKHCAHSGPKVFQRN